MLSRVLANRWRVKRQEELAANYPFEYLKVDNSPLKGDGDRMRAIIRAQLGQNALYVSLDCVFSDS